MNLEPVLDLLQLRTGLDPVSLGSQAVQSAVAARLRSLRIEDVGLYIERLTADPAEFLALVDEVIVAETWFLRGGELFTYLAEYARTTLRGRKPGGVFRALSVPCSTGEEPFSLALALTELGVPASRFRIDGVDISPRNIQQAKRGLFFELSFRQTPPDLRGRHFRLVAGGWEIDPVLSQTVRFFPGNLLDPGFLALEQPYDLIFCRNLFIYLRSAARQQGLAVLTRLLAPQGLLCLGHAESLDPEDRRFERAGPAGFFLYRQTSRPALPLLRPRGNPAPLAPQPVRVPPPVAVQPLPVTERPASFLARARRQADAGQLADAMAVCQTVLERFGPTADLYSLMGVIHQARHERDAAVHSFRKALYLDPYHPEALMHLMLLYQLQGECDQAALLRRRLDRLAAPSPGGGEK